MYILIKKSRRKSTYLFQTVIKLIIFSQIFNCNKIFQNYKNIINIFYNDKITLSKIIIIIIKNLSTLALPSNYPLFVLCFVGNQR